MPPHTLRTSLGFADHHAFYYVWLLSTLAWLLLLVDSTDGELWTGRTVTLAALFGLSLAGQLLSWNGSPLLFAPLAAFVAVNTVSQFRIGNRENQLNHLLSLGFLVAGASMLLAHFVFGWAPRSFVLIPFLFAAGTFVISGVSKGIERVGGTVSHLATTVVASGLTLAAFAMVLGPVRALTDRGVTYITAHMQSDVAASKSLVGAWGGVFSGPLLMFGLLLFLGVGALVWVTYHTYRTHDPEWLAMASFTWFLTLMSVFVMRRFSGELSPLLAIFASVGFVALADWTDIVAPFDLGADRTDTTLSFPNRQTGAYLLVLFVLTSGLSVVVIPGWIGAVTHSEELHDTARWMATDSKERGATYPENYVFGSSGENPMLNYFVNERPTYFYARNHFPQFLTSTSPREWYETLRDRGSPNPRYRGSIGYIVLQSQSLESGTGSMYDRLYRHHGSQYTDIGGVSHYRLRYVHPSRSVKVFTLVDGANITGNTSLDGPIEITSDQTIDGISFTYRRTVAVDGQGRFNVTVPYPGEYEIGDRSVHVSENDVTGGVTLEVTG